ncbi:MAG: flagellar motor protein MotB, partial [Spirochaetota bacterium]
VKKIFISAGIEASKISTKGMGASEPVQSNQTAAGRRANRRIEIYLDKNLSNIPQLKGLLKKK